MLLRSWSFVAFAALVVSACGPSFQVVYEGDARFEHCYALDETPTAPMQEKTDCWGQWMRSYTYGQTRNRVDYAASRAKALRAVPAMPTDEAVMSAAPGEAASRVGRDEPITTNAFATPPKTQNEGDGGPPPVTGTVTTTDLPQNEVRAAVPIGSLIPQIPPREACTERCRSEWQVCRGTCASKCGGCDRSFGGCMKRCF